MDNKELLDNSIKALESLKGKKLNYVRIDTSDNGDGELNLSVDVDYFEQTKSDEEVFKAEGSA